MGLTARVPGVEFGHSFLDLFAILVKSHGSLFETHDSVTEAIKQNRTHQVFFKKIQECIKIVCNGLCN